MSPYKATGRRRQGRSPPMMRVEIAPGVLHYPGLSRPRRPGGAARRNRRRPRRRAAVRSAHAKDRQAVLGPDEQLRPARLGRRTSAATAISRRHPADRRALAADAGAALAALGRARARRAAARSVPDQPLRRRPRGWGCIRTATKRSCRRPVVSLSLGDTALVPGRRPDARRADALVPPRLRRRDDARRPRPASPSTGSTASTRAPRHCWPRAGGST